LNKSDQPQKLGVQEILEKLGRSRERCVAHFVVSARTGAGVEELKGKNGLARIVRERSDAGTFSDGEGGLFLSLRQREILREVKERVERALEALNLGYSTECLTFDLRLVITAFSRLLGRDLPPGDHHQEYEEILGQVFSSFCIGK
jgi:tRNA U34 5-carboxymethylaminomethyl modifying GTPase MnmE/TrmE